MSAQDLQVREAAVWLPFHDDELVMPNTRRVAEGPSPRFGDGPSWDLDALGWSPNVGPRMNRIRFNNFSPGWIPIAKCVAMAMLNPTHQALRTEGIFRTSQPYKPKTVRMFVDGMAQLAIWASASGRGSDLSAWSQRDCDAYLAWVDSNRAGSTQRLAVDVCQLLYRYSLMLPAGGLQFEPWHGTPGTQLLNQTNSDDAIKTPAIPPDVWWPLIRACWRYIDVFSVDILAAQKQLDQIQPANEESTPDRLTPRWIDSTLNEWINSTGSHVPLHMKTYGNAVAGEVSWRQLALLITGGRSSMIFAGSGSAQASRRELVTLALSDGLPTRNGCVDVPIASVERLDGSQGQWINGFDPATILLELTTLRNACYIFCAAMTMMRDSELQSIKSGCLTTFYGAPALRSGLHKHQPHGTEAHWWITEPVAAAIAVAEKITLDEGRLFGSRRTGRERTLQGFDQHDEINKFVQRINSRCNETGLERIPEAHLAPHMFRRTMAIITAQQPDGEIALGITLKHSATRALANATTSGYAAVTDEWAREFKHEQQEHTAARLVYHWSQRSSGHAEARGAGAGEFVKSLDRVAEQLHDNVSVGNPRMLRDLLRDEFSEIRLGTLNHCLGDPDRAACLADKSAAVKAGGMLPSLCSPASCRNSVITDTHIPIWIAEENDLLSKLKDRAMADVHRQRLEAQLVDVRKITKQEPR